MGVGTSDGWRGNSSADRATAAAEQCGTSRDRADALEYAPPPITRAEFGHIFAQDGFFARFDWGSSSAHMLAAGVDMLVIVDVLSCTTAVGLL